MKKKITRSALTLTLTACLALGPQLIPPAAAGSFKDTSGHWAGQVVEASYALDLLKGYPGGLFKPEDPVSRLEAIAIVIRAMGLEKEATEVDWKNSGIKLPQGMFWGQGHLVLAVRENLLRKDYTSTLKYKDPITRQEVAALITAALWEDKLKDKSGDVEKLSFTDKADIGEDYLPYVACVTQNNIMQGLGENQFGPNDTMKRGQMAALMVKTVKDGWFDYGKDNVVTGRLTAIDTLSGIITITQNDGGIISRLTDDDTVFFRDSGEAGPDDFDTGERVLAITSAGKIRYMEATGDAAPAPGDDSDGTGFELTGKIVQSALTGTPSLRIRDTGYREQSFTLADTAVITQGANYKNRWDLTEGTYVTVRVKNNVIESVSILSSEETRGEVTEIKSGYFTVKTDAGSSRVFSVNSSELKIERGGDRLPFSDLKTGDRVQVVSILGEAREILLDGVSSYSEGQVRSVDSFYWMVTLLHDDGTRREYEVELNAPITKDGDRVRIDALEQGDEVQFELGSDGTITEIEVVGEDNLEGEVTDLRTGSSPRIYVDSARYYLDDDVEITRDGDDIDLEDIMIGAEVSVKLGEEDLVTEIEVTDDQDITVEGVITGLDEDRNRITIEQSNGLEFTLRVDSDCDFRDATASSSDIEELGDLEEDWEVRLYLDNGRVEKVRILEK